MREPQAVDELRSLARLAPGASPESLVADLPTRTALVYLQARHRLGAKLSLKYSGSRQPSTESRVVSVAVSEIKGVLKEQSVIVFNVDLQKLDDIWLVTRLQIE